MSESSNESVADILRAAQRATREEIEAPLRAAIFSLRVAAQEVDDAWDYAMNHDEDGAMTAVEEAVGHLRAALSSLTTTEAPDA